MLEDQPWIKYGNDINMDWQQTMDEGRDVESLKEVCFDISQKESKEDYKEIIEQVRNKLTSAPMRKDYAYNEPSDLSGIKSEKHIKRHVFDKKLNSVQLYDKLAGAWIGRISGCLLGKPIEGFMLEKINTILKNTDNYPMRKYICKSEFSDDIKEKIQYNELCLDQRSWADCCNGIAPIDDDTNYTVFAMKLIETYGEDFKPNDVLEAWLSWIPMLATCTAERVAYRNAATGLYAPQTALFENPYREWIGAQIRGDYFGYINIADPEKAADMAWRDASISHVKNGIYGEMFVAAMIASAAVCDDIMTVIESGLDEIPRNCRLRHCVELVIEWYGNGFSDQEVIEKIHKSYNEASQHDWCHTNSNAMIVTMALLYGKKNFGKSICLAVQSGFDTDCNGATVGSIIGIMVGESQIPSYWYECYNQRLATSIAGYNEVTIKELVEKTKRHGDRNPV